MAAASRAVAHAVPAGQLIGQLEEPGLLEVPAGHAVQLAADAGEKKPAGHCRGLLAPVGQ